MLKIGCAKIDMIIEILDGKELNGIKFELIKKKGIQAEFNHGTVSAQQAKNSIKPLFKSDPRTKNFFVSIEAIES